MYKNIVLSQAGANGSGGGGGGGVQTLTGNTGGAVSPTAGNINVIGSGIISVAGNPGTSTETISITNPIPIANGGTNAISMTTTDGVVYYDGTSLVTTSAGTAGQILTSNGAGVAPTYQAGGGGGSTVYFSYNLASAILNITGDGSTGTVVFDTVIINIGGSFNGTNFTAPSTGLYTFSYILDIAGIDATNGQLYINFGSYYPTLFQAFPISSGTEIILNDTITVYLTMGDVLPLQITIAGASKNIRIEGSGLSSISGYKVA